MSDYKSKIDRLIAALDRIKKPPQVSIRDEDDEQLILSRLKKTPRGAKKRVADTALDALELALRAIYNSTRVVFAEKKRLERVKVALNSVLEEQRKAKVKREKDAAAEDKRLADSLKEDEVKLNPNKLRNLTPVVKKKRKELREKLIQDNKEALEETRTLKEDYNREEVNALGKITKRAELKDYSKLDLEESLRDIGFDISTKNINEMFDGDAFIPEKFLQNYNWWR